MILIIINHRPLEMLRMADAKRVRLNLLLAT